MKSITKIALALCVFCGLVFAEGQLKVSFHFAGKEPKAGMHQQLADPIKQAMLRSKKYTIVDIAEKTQKLLVEERERTRSGLTEEKSEMGIQEKPDYILVIEVFPSLDKGVYYLRAEMINIKESTTKKIGSTTSNLSNYQELKSAAEEIIADLVDIDDLVAGKAIDWYWWYDWLACMGDGARSKEDIMQVIGDINRQLDLDRIYIKYLKLKPGFRGKVTLKFTINCTGEIIGGVRIVSSTTGYPEFDNEIKDCVSKWKWKYKYNMGNTTPTVPFNFGY